MKTGSSGLSGWSDRKFIQKNQTDQKDQPTRQTNPGAFREQEDDQAAHSYSLTVNVIGVGFKGLSNPSQAPAAKSLTEPMISPVIDWTEDDSEGKQKKR